MRTVTILLAMLMTSCGALATTATPTPTRTSAPVATTHTPPTPTPPATPITSAKGGITVRVPVAFARITSPVTVSGDASVFEAALQWRVVDSGGRVFAEGSTTASAGAPLRGAFNLSASFAPPPADTMGAIEVFDRSPKDGTIDELVRVPVVITH